MLHQDNTKRYYPFQQALDTANVCLHMVYAPAAAPGANAQHPLGPIAEGGAKCSQSSSSPAHSRLEQGCIAANALSPGLGARMVQPRAAAWVTTPPLPEAAEQAEWAWWLDAGEQR